MSVPAASPSTWTIHLPDGGTVVVTYNGPSPSTTPPAPVPPQPVTTANYQPNVPASVAARLNPVPVFDDQFLTPEKWGTQWADDWFGGEKFNNQPLDAANITWPTGGGVSLGVSNGGKTGCMMNTNPNDPNKPGFQIGYGYVEADITFSSNPAWACFWLNGQSWPQNGENDVIEWLSSGASHIATSNYHGGSTATDSTDHPQNSGTIPGTWAGARAKFGVLRTPDSGGTSARYWKGALVKQFAVHDAGAPEYIILSIGDVNNGGDGPMTVHRVTAWTLSS